jgi:hypothetical protein
MNRTGLATARSNAGAAFLMLLLVACEGRTKSDEASAEQADVIYVNGDVWTGVAGAARAKAVAIKGAHILYVGDAAGARRREGRATEVIDLEGAFVAPGFIDNHVHFLEGGLGLASVDLRDAASRQEFARRIADYAARLPEGRWVLNGNWDNTLWGGELPTRRWIDDATGERPVFVTRLDGHMGLANSAALKAAGIDAATPTPPGGEIIRDEAGAPTGILKDAAMDLVIRVIPPLSDAALDEAFDRAQAHALAHGVTGVSDVYANTLNADPLPVFRRAHDDGRQKIRIRAYGDLGQWERRRDFIAEHGKGDERLAWDGVKGFVDGSLGSATAWFFEPFTDRPESTGLTITDPGTLKRRIRDADAAGLRLAVHAIGDRANDFLLSAYEEIGGGGLREKRFRIEHAQHLTNAEIERFGKTGIIASMQPYHAIDDGRWAESRIGAERIRGTYAFRALLDAGAVVTFGSDWPVAPLDPIAGIDAAAHRRTIDGANPQGWVPGQKITAEEALAAYTAANAYAGFAEEKLGTLAPGKLADLVVLSADPTRTDDILSIRVLRTVIAGETVFEAR